MESPTERSLKYLRNDGWTVEIVEKFNTFTKTRHDLFGFADLVAMKPGHKPKLVQVTSDGWASRIAKIAAQPKAGIALQSGFEIEVHGWRRLASNKGKMTIKIIHITSHGDMREAMEATASGDEDEDRND